ncbi:MAG: ribosome biogenesis GTPase Der [bacterium]
MSAEGMPVVAIVGRPNVGKSALFNRLMGRRISIVADTPGVTRDRIQGLCTRGRTPFLLLDGGGFAPEARRELERAVEKQIARSIAMADLIVFVVDAGDGLVPEDRRVAEVLRREGKPVVVAANKADAAGGEGAAGEFFGLGLGEPLAVSAIHGTNADELLERIAEGLGGERAAARSGSPARVCIVGRPNVGKSSLVNAILGEERCVVSREPGTTRDAVDAAFSFEGRDYVIVDTAGMKKKRTSMSGLEYYGFNRARRAIRAASIAVLLLDAEEGIVDGDKKIAAYVRERGKALIIGVNRIDLIENPDFDRFLGHLAVEAPFLRYTPVVFLSALTGVGLRELLSEVGSVREKMEIEFPAVELEETMYGILEMFPPASAGGGRGVAYGVRQVRKSPLVIALDVNRRECFPATYVAMLENRFVEINELYGAPLRIVVREVGGGKRGRGGSRAR